MLLADVSYCSIPTVHLTVNIVEDCTLLSNLKGKWVKKSLQVFHLFRPSLKDWYAQGLWYGIVSNFGESWHLLYHRNHSFIQITHDSVYLSYLYDSVWCILPLNAVMSSCLKIRWTLSLGMQRDQSTDRIPVLLCGHCNAVAALALLWPYSQSYGCRINK